MTDHNQPQQAIIYCRVSSDRQVKEGHGLDSQETRCREYARYKNYEIAAVFHDEGVSGSLIERPGMNALIHYLMKNRTDQPVVIIDDITRLARGISAHSALRKTISAADGQLESPSLTFGEDPDSLLFENIMASMSQHQRQKNSEQVKNRMRARAFNGYWGFYPVIGYRYEKVPGHGKMLVRNEPVASVIQAALEGFAQGRFETQSEVKRFLESHEAFPKGRDGKIHFQRVTDLLGRVLYAGYIDLPDWGLTLHPAKHEALISYETWQRIQERLKTKAKAPARKDIRDDFPLRGFITCGSCNQPLTSCWSREEFKKYPYYLCRTKGCAESGKSVRKEKMEGEFEDLLLNLRPSRNLFYMALDMFRDLWDERLLNRRKEIKVIEHEANKIGHKIEKLLDRIVETDTDSVIATYENRIRELESKKRELSEKIKTCGTALPEFENSFRTPFGFLSNPHKIWCSERLEDKEPCSDWSSYRNCPMTEIRVFERPNTPCPSRF